MRSQVAQAETPAEAMHASNALTKQLSSLIAVAENYPELKANNSFIKLQDELTIQKTKFLIHVSCSIQQQQIIMLN